ncbi:MAG: hypothetical protein IT308_04445 [Anaerolineaceae bacterium]|nr:hypothetical protein [Anaerolineaceae bacterium]
MKNETNSALDQAMALIRSGAPEEAGSLLAGAVRKDPKNAAAWMLLAGYAPDPERQRFCLERSLALAPDNTAAQQLLQTLELKASIALPDLLAAVGNLADPKGTDFISLSCPNCGGTLRVTEEKERYTCPHCGQEHLLRVRAGLEPVLEKLHGVQQGVDRAADELALQRLGEEIARLEQAMQANNRLFSHGGQFLLTGVLVLLIYFFVVIFNLLLYLGAFLVALGLFYLLYGLKNRAQLYSAVQLKHQEASLIRPKG